MCVIKWALKNNLRQPVSTYFLSWPSKNTFRATCLQMLSMWGCHFNSSSLVIPRTLCSRTCSVMFVPSVSLSIRGLSWCFCLETNTMLFVFPGWTTMRFWSHHFDTSFKPSWRLRWTDFTFVPCEWIELSSAKRPHTTLVLSICRGRSLMKILNRSGPRTEPCGTSHLTTPFVK